ncbi:MAG: hypothetical protein IPL79_02905 [Myxococcales bacterium]|nr:hypothetical protein [Myxococcales bacterium]
MPSAVITTAWAAALTIIVMAPIFLVAREAAPQAQARAGDAGGAVAANSRQDVLATAEAAREPMRGFLVKHAAAADVEVFRRLAAKSGRTNVASNDWLVVAPAFALTEFREALMLGLILMLPFLVLDVVAGVALSILGLGNVAVASVALPLKLMLFIFIDGWRLVSETLVSGYFP